jgi:DNA-binding SARP family transcriptional activator
MRLGILGPVAYLATGTWRRPAGTRQQRLLAVLLLADGRLTPEDSIVEALWDADPPPTAARQVVNTASKLRRELGRHGGPAVESGAGGYRIELAGHELDERTFREHTAAARARADLGDLAGAGTVLRQAIELWRGPALTGLRSLCLQVAADQLDESRLAALEDLAWLELRRHNATEALRLLAEPLGKDPFRERTASLHMLALSGVGRRTDALAGFRRLRSSLVAQLGVEPQRDLVDLHQEILRGAHFADLVATLSRPASGAVRAGGTPRQPVHR